MGNRQLYSELGVVVEENLPALDVVGVEAHKGAVKKPTVNRNGVDDAKHQGQQHSTKATTSGGGGERQR